MLGVRENILVPAAAVNPGCGGDLSRSKVSGGNRRGMRPWIPLVLLLLAACDRKQPAPAIAAPIAPSTAVTPRDAAIKSFWQWFAQNAAALYADHDLVAVMKKITVELKRVSPGMLCELSSAQEDRSLILSA